MQTQTTARQLPPRSVNMDASDTVTLSQMAHSRYGKHLTHPGAQVFRCSETITTHDAVRRVSSISQSTPNPYPLPPILPVQCPSNSTECHYGHSHSIRHVGAYYLIITIDDINLFVAGDPTGIYVATCPECLVSGH